MAHPLSLCFTSSRGKSNLLQDEVIQSIRRIGVVLHGPTLVVSEPIVLADSNTFIFFGSRHGETTYDLIKRRYS